MIEEPTTKPCPCCGEQIPGELFELESEILAPLPIIMLQQQGFKIKKLSEHVYCHDVRVWIRARINLPLDWDETPLTVVTWIEVDARIASSFIYEHVRDKKPLLFSGTLANDVPGFPGSIGAFVLAEVVSPDNPARVICTSDRRIDRFSHREHETLAQFYRQIWGGSGDVPEPDLAIRGAVKLAWGEFVGQDIFIKDLVPPPNLAGMKPLQVCVAPPRDTGDEVAIASVGLSDVSKESPVELITYAREANDEFIESFKTLCYLPFATDIQYQPLAIYTANMPIANVEGMNSWMLAKPWWLDSDDHFAQIGALSIDYLAAIPIRSDELEFATMAGVDALLHKLEHSDLDVMDLSRESCLQSD